MFLFWIAGFMFSMGYLNKCSGKENCLSQLATIETLKLFFIWPFVLGVHCSKKCTEKDTACCSPADNETDQANTEDFAKPVEEVAEAVEEVSEAVEDIADDLDSLEKKDT